MNDPIGLWLTWYREAQDSLQVDADAMALSTCTQTAYPSVRILYFRRLIEGKFCFFTNYTSHKGKDLADNPRAAAVFLWHPLGRQVNLEGNIEKLNARDSDDYFYKRSFESQLSAATSKQSQKLGAYQDFLDEIEANRKKFGDKVSRPGHWGGYALDPQSIEFWQQGEHRRHQREVYLKTSQGWDKELLYP